MVGRTSLYSLVQVLELLDGEMVCCGELDSRICLKRHFDLICFSRRFECQSSSAANTPRDLTTRLPRLPLQSTPNLRRIFLSSVRFEARRQHQKTCRRLFAASYPQ